jgi:hypothetical protein
MSRKSKALTYPELLGPPRPVVGDLYFTFMCNVMLIILRETVRCLSQQPWGTCRMTWSSWCAVSALHLFIKHCGCTHSTYLSNKPYTSIFLRFIYVNRFKGPSLAVIICACAFSSVLVFLKAHQWASLHVLKLLTPCILINLFPYTKPTKCTHNVHNTIVCITPTYFDNTVPSSGISYTML